ncbi:MAG: hypothetical protein ABIT09_02855 [Croceibacterium sp.]
MASAATGLDGTWKADLASVKVDSKPSEMTLQNGKFTCPTCLPSYSIAADGAFHPLKRPYSDMTSVKVDDDHTVTITSKKGDTVVGMTKYVVSADGKTLTRSFTDSSVPGAKPVTGESTMTRVADAPSGAHALSGSWKLGSYTNMSDEGTTLTLKTDGDMLHLTTPGGISYDAKIGGPAVAIKGDSAGTMAAVTKTGDNSFTETDILDGKTISVTTMVVVADGKLHATSEDKRDGSKSSYDLIRS